MTTSIPTSGRSSYPPAQGVPERTSGAWSGWITFAAIMLVVIGVFQAIEGLVALFQDDFYAVSKNGLVVHINYTGLGWIMLILAAINIAAGLGVATRKTWARIWAIGSAILSLIVNLGFTGAYPIWTVMLVTLDVIVIYALCVHWHDTESAF
jgi:hypothetical protein